jgi:hypothetical protein
MKIIKKRFNLWLADILSKLAWYYFKKGKMESYRYFSKMGGNIRGRYYVCPFEGFKQEFGKHEIVATIIEEGKFGPIRKPVYKNNSK